jgi:hypothetical protein
MLKDPVAKSAADLAAPEKELAHVQGDVEATIAQRDYLGTITEAVRVDIAVTTTAGPAIIGARPLYRSSTLWCCLSYHTRGSQFWMWSY